MVFVNFRTQLNWQRQKAEDREGSKEKNKNKCEGAELNTCMAF